jgi:HlyD family secretion protein
VRKQPQTSSNVVAYVVLAQADNPQGKLLPGMTANADIIVEELKDVLKVPSSALRFTPADAKAQSNRGGGSPIPGFGGGGRQGGGQGQRGGFGGARLLDQLDLDAAQKAKAQPILDAARAKAQANTTGDRRTAMREAMNQAFDQIKPILRPDQLTKLEALRSRFASGGKRGVVWVLRDGQPAPITVRVGASDGTYTQIQSRQLKPGDQVITGGGPRPKAQARGGAIPGMGGGGGGRRGGPF